MTKLFSVIGSILRFLFLKGKADAVKVAPEVQAQIDRILADANSAVSNLRQSSSVATLRKQMEDDIKAVEDTAKHHIALIKADFEKRLTASSAILPSVQSQLAVATGATGLTGSSGPHTGPT